MENAYIGWHVVNSKSCGAIMEKELNKGKHGTKSFHWVCTSCGKEPESREIRK